MAIGKETNCFLFRFSLCSLLLLIIGSCYCQSTNNLRQGRLVKELVSANQRFRLGFFNPPSTTTHYLAISYVKPHELGDDETDKLVWIANRNTPIFDTSGSLTIDSNDGNLKIQHNGGDPIAVSSIPGAGNNTIATLQDYGNLVLQETNHDGSTRRVLWQSFDYPTDTFLPGMKLGINLEADKKWFLQSWITEESPAQGSFTLGVDPNFTNHLSIWWRGEFHSNIGLWRNGIFDSSGDSTVSDFIFSYTSNKQEKYFTYSVKGNVTLFPRLRIMADGTLATHNGKEKLINGYPVCRNASSDFKTITALTGDISNDGFTFKESDNMTINDCQLACQKNCSCIAFASPNENNKTGCQIWSEGTNFTDAVFTNPIFTYRLIYIRETTAAGDSESPAQGSFTLGVDPNFTNHLSIWWRGDFHSNIGIWRTGKFDSLGDSTISDFIFSYTSNKQEK
ncbi:hypothetical protein CUMW_235880 [Citrus unshiu]|uniref:Bulb-type lectin domain-containing protein n=1 Tax=Citrus unshiu TaxID=55188 RepID=A0A2H5QJF9_CITUN|nr:hypothetical protein CUMW_235880 [Citrus unshiu]